MELMDIMNKVIEYYSRVEKPEEHCVVFDDGIVTIGVENNSPQLEIHAGSYHLHEETGENYSEDVHNYMNQGDWDELDEERIVYEDRVVIFGINESLNKFMKQYSSFDRVSEKLNLVESYGKDEE
jgi:hypothetical protein